MPHAAQGSLDIIPNQLPNRFYWIATRWVPLDMAGFYKNSDAQATRIRRPPPRWLRRHHRRQPPGRRCRRRLREAGAALQRGLREWSARGNRPTSEVEAEERKEREDRTVEALEKIAVALEHLAALCETAVSRPLIAL
jgi:hypothetical protein